MINHTRTAWQKCNPVQLLEQHSPLTSGWKYHKFHIFGWQAEFRSDFFCRIRYSQERHSHSLPGFSNAYFQYFLLRNLPAKYLCIRLNASVMQWFHFQSTMADTIQKRCMNALSGSWLSSWWEWLYRATDIIWLRVLAKICTILYLLATVIFIESLF